MKSDNKKELAQVTTLRNSQGVTKHEAAETPAAPKPPKTKAKSK